MVMNMIEKKDPHQKTITDDPSDDDDIIELTDEVITKPQEDDRTAGPQKSANISAQTAKTESVSDDGDDIIDLKDTHETELSEDEDFIDLNDPVQMRESQWKRTRLLLRPSKNLWAPMKMNLMPKRSG